MAMPKLTVLQFTCLLHQLVQETDKLYLKEKKEIAPCALLESRFRPYLQGCVNEKIE